MDRPLRILHLEDNPHDRELIQEILQNEGVGMAITSAATRVEFVRALEQAEFDIILSDKSLPAFDGLEALHLAKEIRPDVPFVFVSGSMGEEAAIETIKHGATDYVLKDRLNRLHLAIGRAIREAEQIQKTNRSAEALRRSEERFQLIARASNDIIWDWNIENNTCWISHSIHRFGYTDDVSTGGRPWLDHVPAEDRPRVLEAFNKCLEGEDHFWSDEYPFLRKDGVVAHIFNRGYIMRNAEGRATRIVGAMMDITERKAAEEKIKQQEAARKQLEAQFLRAQRLQNIGALASGIAHDLNNVLSPILMGVPFLKEQITDDSSLNVLSAMESSAMRGAGIVKQVLTFARGTTEERAILQPNHLITEMVRIMRETFPKSIQIKTQCDSAAWEIEGNATQIHQILLNLCVNARDAMPNGGMLTITSANVTLHESKTSHGLTTGPGDYVQVQVSDSGTGIPPEIQNEIFKPFFTTKDPSTGTGLGLSTTMTIIQSHQGSIQVESTPGRGTVFTLLFPATPDRQLADSTLAAPNLPPGRNELVLMVDDEVGIREMCKVILENFEYRALTAENGVEALLLLERNREQISVVIIDMMMPIMDGSAAIRAIRWSAPHIKIIATSGLTEKEQYNALGDVRPDGFLHKPYTAAQLVSTLGKVLGRG